MLTVAVPKRNKLPNIIVLTPKDGIICVINDSILSYYYIIYISREKTKVKFLVYFHKK